MAVTLMSCDCGGICLWDTFRDLLIGCISTLNLIKVALICDDHDEQKMQESNFCWPLAFGLLQKKCSM